MNAVIHLVNMLTLITFTYLFIMFAIVQFKGDRSIGNFTWGGGVLLLTLYLYYISLPFPSLRQTITTILIFLWAIRLIIYVYVRYTGKDPRFKNWKSNGLKSFLTNLLWIFGQFLLIAIMILPSIVSSHDNNLSLINIIGLCVWIFGFVFESISDYQLFVFLHNEKNSSHVMQSGLWRYSRHPNYFGEVLMWWGIYLLVITSINSNIAILAPITITILLRYVTGVPMLENAMKDNMKYQEYKKETNIFVPWFVKN